MLVSYSHLRSLFVVALVACDKTAAPPATAGASAVTHAGTPLGQVTSASATDAGASAVAEIEPCLPLQWVPGVCLSGRALGKPTTANASEWVEARGGKVADSRLLQH